MRRQDTIGGGLAKGGQTYLLVQDDVEGGSDTTSTTTTTSTTGPSNAPRGEVAKVVEVVEVVGGSEHTTTTDAPPPGLDLGKRTLTVSTGRVQELMDQGHSKADALSIASEAARRAGYRTRPNVAGPRLLANDSIQAVIRQRLTEASLIARRWGSAWIGLRTNSPSRTKPARGRRKHSLAGGECQNCAAQGSQSRVSAANAQHAPVIRRALDGRARRAIMPPPRPGCAEN